MDSDDDFSTTLAYTKSPKTAKRTSFQDELKKAISAHVSRQQAIEEPEDFDYSEEFDSEDSLNESSDEENLLKSKLKKTFRDFNMSDEENEVPQKLSFLKNKHQLNEHGNENSGKNTGISGRGVLKSPSLDERKNDARNIVDKESKPIPKPREARLKSPMSTQGVSISTLDESFKPTPQQRNLLKKSRHVEDTDYALTEEVHSSTKYTSIPTPSSVTRLSDKVSASEGDDFAERFSPEVPKMSRQPSMDSKFKSQTSDDEKNLTFSREPSSTLQDLQIQGKEDLQNNGRKSPSVLELVLSTVKEKSKQENKATLLEDTDCNFQTKNSEARRSKEENSELGRSHSSRSLPCQETIKKSAKHSTKMSAKSRYLGTLTVLDKSLKESTKEIEAADVLRATVYQNWLEKKNVFLKELHKCKKTKEDQEKEKNSKEGTIKKEEAKAAFLAWKSEKKKDIHMHLMKQKEEEEKKMTEIREIVQKKEDAKRAFEKWKEAKDLYLKEKTLKEKEIETDKKRKEQKNALEKKKESVSAVKYWSERKDHVLKKKKKDKVSEKLKAEKLKAMKEEQEKKAMELYEEWLEKKERKERLERKYKKLQGILGDDPPPPWSPPGKTIPTGR